jgi:predicted ATPase
MRLDRLRIPNYRNLRSFEIDFDESQPTTVLLGRNGCGKSNLIEAIVEIFRDLENGEAPPFAYTIDYVCRERAIHIDADPSRKGKRLDITIDDNKVSQTAFQQDIDSYLPNYVFAYYSGWSSRLERHFDQPTRSHYSRVLKAADGEFPLRRLFFCRKEYSQLVLLAFFLTKVPAAREVLTRYLGIQSFDSALFVMKTPWWGSTGGNLKRRELDGDARFWHAGGAFRGFLDRLWRRALAPIRNTESVDRDVRRKPESTERLYLFIKNTEELARLREGNEAAKDVFSNLESLFLCDLIDEVRVTVVRTDGTRVKFTQLSEGEQQLLTVLGLLLFTQHDESLYLLDEPDTHLNPFWTYEFLKLLEENMRPEKGQLVVATHNPLMIGSLRKEQVRILAARGNRAIAEPPDYDPAGIGVEGLLKSEIYGLRSTLAPDILQKLDRHYKLLGTEPRSAAEQSELMRLAREINDMGVSRTHPNPYFEAFACAMARSRDGGGDPASHPPGLSKQTIAEQAALADKVLREVLSKRTKSRTND